MDSNTDDERRVLLEILVIREISVTAVQIISYNFFFFRENIAVVLLHNVCAFFSFDYRYFT